MARRKTKAKLLDDIEGPGDTFPYFKDGDVRVTITGSRQYQLHSGVLKNASPVMRELLSDENRAPLDARTISAGAVVYHKLILVPNPDLDDDDEEDDAIKYVLQRLTMNAKGQTVGNVPAGVGMELEGGRIIDNIFLAYHGVLGAMYNQPICLGDSQRHDLFHLLSNAHGVTTVSEYLDCIRIVSKPIEAALLATGQSLNISISNNPIPWLNFAARVKSRAIFKEALIHAAGQFNQPEIMEKINSHYLAPDVLAILVKKGKWVQQTISDSTRYLASYYPSMLLREVRPGDKDSVSRASYGNDIMMWIAVCIFRHWICDLMASDRTHHARDMGWAFINAICVGGDTYLSRNMLQHNFHTRFPMTSKGMACVEHRLAEIKDDVKQWAIPLKINNSSLDLSQHAVAHFLHTNVHLHDIPWEKSENAKQQTRREEADDEESDDDDDDEGEEEDENEYEEDYKEDDKAGDYYDPDASSGDEEMFDAHKLTHRDGDIFNTQGAGDEENDTEEFDEKTARYLEQTAKKDYGESKLRVLDPDDE